MTKTHTFSRCIAVFEGGGVRGAAFAGALDEAVRRGVTLTGAVGASAGSIVAALVGADMAPSDIASLLIKLEFTQLLSAPTPNLTGQSHLVRLIQRALPGKKGSLIRSALNLGQHSSVRISEWVNSVLAERLGTGNRPVVFADLPKPIAIIATDLSRRTYRLWSSAKTPTSEVGQAVRASCSIPFFFQPVFDSDSALVDGGLIANLPLLLTREVSTSEYVPVLCFRLVSTAKHRPSDVRGIAEFTSALVASAISGVSDLQMNYSTHRQVIDIDTGDIGTTDFSLSKDQKLWLFDKGKQAVADFIVNEQTRVVASTPAPPPTHYYREELLIETIRLIRAARKDISILAGDLSWLKELHLSLLAAKLRGVPIRILCVPREDDDYRKAMESALAIGAEICEVPNAFMVGTIIDGDLPTAQMVAVEKSPTMHGRRLRSPEDGNLITLLRDYYSRVWNPASVRRREGSPRMYRFSEEAVCAALSRNVEQYRGLQIHWATVEIANINPLTRHLRALKLERLCDLESLHEITGTRSGFAIEGSKYLVTPIVVEQLANGTLCVIDGTHRLFTLMQNGNTKARVAVVVNPRSNLPAVPEESWSRVVIERARQPEDVIYANYQPDMFRRLVLAYEVELESIIRPNNRISLQMPRRHLKLIRNVILIQ